MPVKAAVAGTPSRMRRSAMASPATLAVAALTRPMKMSRSTGFAASKSARVMRRSTGKPAEESVT